MSDETTTADLMVALKKAREELAKHISDVSEVNFHV